MLTEYVIMQTMTDQQRLLFTSQFGGVKKDPTTALLLAFFLGGIGGHKFYMGRVGMGLVYLLFCWTFLPSLAALIECFLIKGQVREFNEAKAIEVATQVKMLSPSNEGEKAKAA
jgi:TM2 domain-containing membrane protein YozV